jgi:ParB-like chromosome segregation protein Spo0J
VQYEDGRFEERVAPDLIKVVDTKLESLVLNVSIQAGRKIKEIEIVSEKAAAIFACINAWVSENSVYDEELKDKLAAARVQELLHELNDRVAAPTDAEMRWVLKRSLAKGSSNEFDRRRLRDAIRVWYPCVFPRRDKKIGRFQEVGEREFMHKVRHYDAFL